jgi:hypothetical protein
MFFFSFLNVIKSHHTKSVTIYRVFTKKNLAVSKVNKKFISHLTRAQRTPSTAATVQVSHALPEIGRAHV